MSQIKKLINQKFLEGIDSTKFHVAQNGAIMAKDSSGSMVEFLKVNSDSKGVVLGKVISTKDELDAVIADLAQEILDRQAGDLDAKAYADQKIADLINGAPALLDTLKELADAIANDENFAATIGGQIGQLQSDLAAEIVRAQAAEAALSGRLDTAEGDIDALEGRATSLEGRMTSAESDIGSLEGRMDLAEEAIGELQSGLAQEILDREAGDEQSLQDAKDYADSKVLEEKGLREAADVQVLVDAKAYTDAEVSEEMGRAEGIENLLRSDLNAEIQSRMDGDTALGDEIDAERDARIAEDALKVSKEGDDMTGPLNITVEDGSLTTQIQLDVEGIKVFNTDPEEGQNSEIRLNGGYVEFNDFYGAWSRTSGVYPSGTSFYKNAENPVDNEYAGYYSDGVVSNNGAGKSMEMNTNGGFFHSETIDGVQSPIMPTVEWQMTPKKYVDDQDAAKLQEAKDYAEEYADSKVSEEATVREAEDLTFLKLDGSREMTGNLTLVDSRIEIQSGNLWSRVGTASLIFKDENLEEGLRIAKGLEGNKDVIQTASGLNLMGEFNVMNSMSAPSPTDNSHVANKEYVDAGDAAEQARAIAAEGVLQSAIDVEKGRIDAILDASQADKDSFAEIVSLINSVDTENDSAFASYVLSNNAALAQEVSDRQSGDSALQTSLEAEVTRAMSAEGVIAEDLADEVSRAQAAEGVLQSNIDAEVVARSTADTTLQGNINSEQSAREAADVALGGRIDSAEASIASLSSTKADKSYVDTQDAGLQSQIDGLDGRLDIIEGADSVEGSVAKAEKDAKDYADSKFAEAQSNADDIEGFAQDVRDDLDAEIARAEAAEGELDGRIDILEALSFHKEFKTVGASDLMHVDLLLKAKPNSVKVYVGRLALHENHDFTVGENMGVTRIYWTGDFMNLAEEGIEEGMKLFFEYYC